MIEIHLELKNANGGYVPVLVCVEKLSNSIIADLIQKYEVNGTVVNSWEAHEKLPFDEGNESCIAGCLIDENPYSDKSWKHNEWELGFNSCEESKL